MENDQAPPEKPKAPKLKRKTSKKNKKNKGINAKKTTAPAPLGRPSSFRPEYVAMVEEMCNRGATDEEIAAELGVNVRTVQRWRLQNENFCRALKSGKDYADDRVERSLFQRATGYVYLEKQAIKIKRTTFDDTTGKKIAEYEEVVVVDVERVQTPDTTAGIFWLKNRRREQWRDVQEKSYSGGIVIEERPQQLDADRLDELGSRFGRPLKIIEGGK